MFLKEKNPKIALKIDTNITNTSKFQLTLRARYTLF